MVVAEVRRRVRQGDQSALFCWSERFGSLGSRWPGLLLLSIMGTQAGDLCRFRQLCDRRA